MTRNGQKKIVQTKFLKKELQNKSSQVIRMSVSKNNKKVEATPRIASKQMLHHQTHMNFHQLAMQKLISDQVIMVAPRVGC